MSCSTLWNLDNCNCKCIAICKVVRPKIIIVLELEISNRIESVNSFATTILDRAMFHREIRGGRFWRVAIAVLIGERTRFSIPRSRSSVTAPPPLSSPPPPSLHDREEIRGNDETTHQHFYQWTFDTISAKFHRSKTVATNFTIFFTSLLSFARENVAKNLDRGGYVFGKYMWIESFVWRWLVTLLNDIQYAW